MTLSEKELRDLYDDEEIDRFLRLFSAVGLLIVIMLRYPLIESPVCKRSQVERRQQTWRKCGVYRCSSWYRRRGLRG